MSALEILIIVVAILIGLFVLAPGMIKNDQDAQKALAQIREYQGYIGVVAGIFGIVALIILLVDRGWWLLFHLSIIGASIMLGMLGFLLGYQLISEKLLANNEGAREKAEAFRATWDPRQKMLAWAAIILAIAAVILYALR